MNLTISLTDITISDELKDEDFRWGLYNADTAVMLSTGTFKDIGTSTSLTMYRDTIIDATDPDTTKNYILRIWIHEDGTNQNYMQGKSFSAKLTVDGDAVEYTDASCFTVTSDGKIIDYDASCGTDVVIPKTTTTTASATSTTQSEGTISTLERNNSKLTTLAQTATTVTVTGIAGYWGMSTLKMKKVMTNHIVCMKKEHSKIKD